MAFQIPPYKIKNRDIDFSHFDKLLELVQNVDIVKSRFIQDYRSWDLESGKVIKQLREIESNLVNTHEIANFVKVGADIGKVLGAFSILAGELTDDKKTSENLKDFGSCFTTLGTIVSEGSTAIDGMMTKNLCNSAKKLLDQLVEKTNQLDRDRRSYFRLIDEYKNALDELEEKELLILMDHLGEKSPTVSSDNRFGDHAASNFPEIQRLKLDPKALDADIRQRSLISKIANNIINDPTMKCFLEWKCESFPWINGENIARSFVTVANLKNNSTIHYRPLSFNQTGDAARFCRGLNNVLFLTNEICDLINTCSSLDQKSVQSKEVKRAADELKEYRIEVRETLKKSLGWDCFRKDWYAWNQSNSLSPKW